MHFCLVVLTSQGEKDNCLSYRRKIWWLYSVTSSSRDVWLSHQSELCVIPWFSICQFILRYLHFFVKWIFRLVVSDRFWVENLAEQTWSSWCICVIFYNQIQMTVKMITAWTGNVWMASSPTPATVIQASLVTPATVIYLFTHLPLTTVSDESNICKNNQNCIIVKLLSAQLFVWSKSCATANPRECALCQIKLHKGSKRA